MRLTKRGWNNVLIFACLGMIIIFNLMSGKLIENAEGDVVTILPQQSMILTLEYPNVSIERLGTNWRITPKSLLSPADVAELINSWLSVSGEITLMTSEEAGYRVTLWLAGNEYPTKIWIQPNSLLMTDIIKQRSWKVTTGQLKNITM